MAKYDNEGLEYKRKHAALSPPRLAPPLPHPAAVCQRKTQHKHTVGPLKRKNSRESGKAKARGDGGGCCVLLRFLVLGRDKQLSPTLALAIPVAFISAPRVRFIQELNVQEI